MAAGLVMVASWRIGEAEIPRIGVLTATFFVGSLVHLPLSGAVSVHLLLNGLVGLVLGLRAGLVIPVGLLLQALLFGHGGLTVLGVNIAVYTLPAVLTAQACGPLRRSGAIRVPVIRFALVFIVAAVWLGTAVVAVQWAKVAVTEGSGQFLASPGNWWLAEPAVGVALLLTAAGMAWVERWLEADPEFAVGVLLGAVTAFATVGLNCLVLAVGGMAEYQPMASVALLTNLPVVLVEAVGVGFILAFLAKARPEWVGGPVPQPGTGKTSSNGTSH